MSIINIDTVGGFMIGSTTILGLPQETTWFRSYSQEGCSVDCPQDPAGYEIVRFARSFDIQSWFCASIWYLCSRANVIYFCVPVLVQCAW